MIKKAHGFTIVELLIVIVVIAILAAISIVAYTGIQNRTYDSTVKSELANFAKKLELVRVDRDGSYPTTLTSAMGFSFTKNAYQQDGQGYTLRYCVNTGTNQYIMYARSQSGSYFRYTSESGLSTATATFGYAVCEQVGLTSTNPQANGRTPSSWASWVN